MPVSSLLPRLAAALRRRPRRGPLRAHRPTGLEPLESRVMLSATVAWSSITPGGSGQANLNDVVLDSSIEYVAGDFGPATGGVGGDGFVSAYNALGAAQWTVTLSSDHADGGFVRVTNLQVASGVLYLAGEFRGSLTLGSTTLTSTGGGTDLFLARLETNHTLGWVRQIASEGDDAITALNYDAGYDGVIVAGHFTGSLSLDPASVTAPNILPTLTDADGGGFLANYSSSGSLRYAMDFTGTGDSSITAAGSTATNHVLLLALQFTQPADVHQYVFDAAHSEVDATFTQWTHFDPIDGAAQSAALVRLVTTTDAGLAAEPYVYGSTGSLVFNGVGDGAFGTYFAGVFSGSMGVLMDGEVVGLSAGRGTQGIVLGVSLKNATNVGTYLDGSVRFADTFPAADSRINSFQVYNGSGLDQLVIGGDFSGGLSVPGLRGSLPGTGSRTGFVALINQSGGLLGLDLLPPGDAHGSSTVTAAAMNPRLSRLAAVGDFTGSINLQWPGSNIIPATGPSGFIAALSPQVALIPTAQITGLPASFLAGAAKLKPSAQIAIAAGLLGGLTLPAGATITLVARPSGVNNSSRDVTLAQLTNPADAAPGAATTLNYKKTPLDPVALAGLAVGSYRVLVLVQYASTTLSAVAATFTVAAPFIDLGAVIDAARSRVPQQIVAGTATPMTFQLGVLNLGNVPVDKGTVVSASLIAVAADDSTQTVATFDNLSLSGLKPGGTQLRKLKLTTTLPADFAEGTYTFHLVINPAHTPAESTYANNTTEDVGSVNVAAPFVDLDAVLDARRTRLPAGPVVSGGKTKLTVAADITNLGNVPLDRGATVSASLVAVSDNPTQIITTLGTVSLSGLKPGGAKAKTVKFTTTLPSWLTDGDYTFQVIINPDHALTESGYINNTTAGTAALAVQQGYYDLALAAVTPSLPAAMPSLTRDVKASASVTLENVGNLALPRGATALLTLTLVGENSPTVVLDTQTVTLSSLLAKPRRVKLGFTLPADLADDTWTLHITATAPTGFTDSSTANNALNGQTLVLGNPV